MSLLKLEGIYNWFIKKQELLQPTEFVNGLDENTAFFYVEPRSFCCIKQSTVLDMNKLHEKVLDRSLISHPEILHFLDTKFIPAGCFCCYYTRDRDVAIEFNNLAIKHWKNHDFDAYKQSQQFYNDVVTAVVPMTVQQEAVVKQHILLISRDFCQSIKKFLDKLNSVEGIATAYSDSGVNYGTIAKRLWIYKTRQSIDFTIFLAQIKGINTRECYAQGRFRFPYSTFKIFPATIEYYKTFWDDLERHFHQWCKDY